INPDIAVVTVPQIAEDAAQQSVLSASNNVDMYVVEALGVYAQLKARGYLASLNASSTLMEQASALYPCIQETLMADDQLMAFPINMSTKSWTLNQTLWDRFSLGAVPKTYQELLKLMRLLQEDYAADNPDYTLVDLTGGVSSCIKMLVKEYLLQCGDEYPDFTNENFRNAMLAVVAHQDVLKTNAENYGMPLIYTYYQGFGIGYNDDEQTRMMFMPAIANDETQRLSGTLTLLTMSSASTKQDASLRFITFCADRVDAQTKYMMNPKLDTPLHHDNH
ncbi:MAG: ABC transporter substrate-binding protein, partial [Clostridia bacterium]